MITSPEHLGCHRVIEPLTALPQVAWKLDNSPVCRPTEMLISVERLHLDAASFRQICEVESHDNERVKRHIHDIVAQRGKLHNPVTGSGGTLLGTVSELGGRFPFAPAAGTRVSTLVSLTLTPLLLEAIHHVDMSAGELTVSGTAILFSSGLWAPLPADLPESVVLAALDVAGAPATVRKMLRPGQTILILGAGRAGVLSAIAAAEARAGRVILVDISERRLKQIADTLPDFDFICADAREAMQLVTQIHESVDVCISCVNAPCTEPAAILCTKSNGQIVFFSMATSFASATLAAEGVGSPVKMLMGNGFAPGHAEYVLSLLRSYPKIHALLASVVPTTL